MSTSVREISTGQAVYSDDDCRRIVRVSFLNEDGARAYKFLFFACKPLVTNWKLVGYTAPRVAGRFVQLLDSLPKDADPDLTWVD
jgi:hypothetical protein